MQGEGMQINHFVRYLIVTLFVVAIAATSFAQIAISVRFGPPALPVYEQPPCPSEGYMWVPGYWAWGDDGYYWVPGTWVLAPQPGYLWTPPWWGWEGGFYHFHPGYWGTRVGFYGGIVYGFGYFGNGYEGGRWQGDRFYYNRSVTNVNVTNVTNVYNTTVINNTTVNRVSYNGGPGGIDRRPTAEEQAADREQHIQPTAVQTQHVETARGNPQLRASANEGRPPVAATVKPTDFHQGAVPAREAGAPYHPPANQGAEGRPNDVPRPGNDNAERGNDGARTESNVPRPGNNEARPENNGGRPENNVPRPDNNVARPDNTAPRPTNPQHARDLQPHIVPKPPEGSQVNDKYQQQQNKLITKQNQEHDRLAQKQDQEHERMKQQNAAPEKAQQMEQRHEQQTTKMEQKHSQQEQHVQQKYEPHGNGRG
jgi:hypothetical protein